MSVLVPLSKKVDSIFLLFIEQLQFCLKITLFFHNTAHGTGKGSSKILTKCKKGKVHSKQMWSKEN